jgi:hypothetical protein
MVLNDEAHHVDPESAWNEAIEFVDRSIHERNGSEGICTTGFSVTPRTTGAIFPVHHLDSPLGEAVDWINKRHPSSAGAATDGTPLRECRGALSAALAARERWKSSERRS